MFKLGEKVVQYTCSTIHTLHAEFSFLPPDHVTQYCSYLNHYLLFWYVLFFYFHLYIFEDSKDLYLPAFVRFKLLLISGSKSIAATNTYLAHGQLLLFFFDISILKCISPIGAMLSSHPSRMATHPCTLPHILDRVTHAQ